jgi:ethanolaminephosphotransferase
MDNMDGKQARKIGASSPLGMLFDHVCDAINSGSSSIFMGSLFGAGWEWTFWFCILAFIPFHMQTWEEYYRHEMVLPVINGPSEGILMLISMAVFTFFKGSAWWQEELQWDAGLIQTFPQLARFNTMFNATFAFFVVFAISTVLFNSWTVIKIINKEKGCFLKMFMSLLPFISFIVSTIAWKLNSTVAMEFPLISILLICAVFVEGVSHVMLAHIVEDDIKPFERTISWFMLGMAANVCFTPFGQPIVDERLLLIPYFFIALSVTGISLIMICQESASALDIFVFRIGKPSAEEKKKNA